MIIDDDLKSYIRDNVFNSHSKTFYPRNVLKFVKRVTDRKNDIEFTGDKNKISMQILFQYGSSIVKPLLLLASDVNNVSAIHQTKRTCSSKIIIYYNKIQIAQTISVWYITCYFQRVMCLYKNAATRCNGATAQWLHSRVGRENKCFSFSCSSIRSCPCVCVDECALCLVPHWSRRYCL